MKMEKRILQKSGEIPITQHNNLNRNVWVSKMLKFELNFEFASKSACHTSKPVGCDYYENISNNEKLDLNVPMDISIPSLPFCIFFSVGVS